MWRKSETTEIENLNITKFSISFGFLPRDNPSEIPLRTAVDINITIEII